MHAHGRECFLTEAQRTALLNRVSPDQLCVAYYQRLSGELVSAENPLTLSESRSLVQYGIAALSLGAMAATAHYLPQAKPALVDAGQKIEAVAATVKNEVENNTRELIETITAPFRPKREEVIMVLGMSYCPTPPPTPTSPPVSVSPVPAPPAPAPTTSVGSPE